MIRQYHISCRKRICIKMGWIVIYIFNGTGIYKFEAKDSEIDAASLCFGNASKDFLTHNIKKTGLYGHIYNFSVNYDSIGDILDI